MAYQQFVIINITNQLCSFVNVMLLLNVNILNLFIEICSTVLRCRLVLRRTSASRTCSILSWMDPDRSLCSSHVAPWTNSFQNLHSKLLSSKKKRQLFKCKISFASVKATFIRIRQFLKSLWEYTPLQFHFLVNKELHNSYFRTCIASLRGRITRSL